MHGRRDELVRVCSLNFWSHRFQVIRPRCRSLTVDTVEALSESRESSRIHRCLYILCICNNNIIAKMSSQRPKKIKAGRGSITLPPELAAHYLRSAVQNASSLQSNTSDDAEMKALMSMFVEIMGMDGTTTASAEGGHQGNVLFL